MMTSLPGWDVFYPFYILFVILIILLSLGNLLKWWANKPHDPYSDYKSEPN